MHETLAKTSLGALEPGARVNLERAVTPATRLGGHIVQGHVDGTGTVVRRTPSEHWELVEIALLETRSMNRLLPQLSCTRLGGLLMAAAASTTAGRTSNATFTELARSSASARVGAMQAAMGSPTYRTFCVASGGYPETLNPLTWGTARISARRGRSRAVKIRPAASGGIMMFFMRACACGLRTNATSSCSPGFSPTTNCPRPCRWRASSLRSSEAPTPRTVFDGAVLHTVASFVPGVGLLAGGEHCRSRADGGHDIGVAGAAADVARQLLANLLSDPARLRRMIRAR